MKSSGKASVIEALEDRTLLSNPAAAVSAHALASVQAVRDAHKAPARPKQRSTANLPVAAPAPLPLPNKPSIIGAASGGRTHALTVTWKSVAGATGYQLERSTDGVNWSTVQTLPVSATSALDSGLSENTSFRYRVRALNANGASDPSSVAIGKTAAFSVFDATFFANRPADLGQGISPIYVSYRSTVDPSLQPNEAATRALARMVADQGQMLVLDIESWVTDIRENSPLEVSRTISKFLEVIDWARSERPNLKIGVFSDFPLTPFVTDQSASQAAALKQANDFLITRIAPSIDFIVPGLYASFADPGDWQAWAKVSMDEARRFGKPIYAFVWMNYNIAPYAPLPMDYWKFILGTVRTECDAMVLWGGDAQTWDPSADWWNATQQFLAQPAVTPAAPTALKINATGAILSWNDNSNNESGFQIERSPDGVNFTVVGATGADVATWNDSRLSSGQVYYYRVSALSAWGSSSASNIVSAKVARNALVLNQAEGFEQSLGVVAGTSSALSLDAGDWILYRNVDFGAGANQLDLRIAVPQAFAGQQIEIHLDSVNGPLIGAHTVAGASDYADFAVQSFGVTLTSGTHDIYFTFKARPSDGDGSAAAAFDWFKFANNAPPAAPGKLIVNSAGAHISLAWSDYSDDETGFLIERSIDGINFAPLTTVGANVTAFDDSGLSLGVRYSYRVRALNPFGSSDPSNTDLGVRGTRNALALIQAEDFDVQANTGILNSSTVGFIDNGDYLGYLGVDFGQGVNQVMMRGALPYIAEGGAIEMRIDDVNGPVIGTLALHGTGGYFNFSVQFGSVALTTGVHDLYLIFRGASGIVNLDWIAFSGPG